MSRDQKPGRVRHVGVTQPSAGGAPAASSPAGQVAARSDAPQGAGGAAAANATAPAKGGGLSIAGLLIFLVAGAAGGVGLVMLAPMLGVRL